MTLALIAAALWVSFGTASERLSAGARLERAAVLRGELWRILTGHLVHGWPALAATDLGALAVLGIWVERRSRAELAIGLGLGAVLASASILLLRPDLAAYEGSSALASAAFACCALQLLRASDDPAGRWLALMALAGFGAKLRRDLRR